ncbi:MAG: chorismate synthase [Planctomycetota bacterium]
MSRNTYGELFRMTSFGESHGKALGVVIDGCPSGIELDEEDLRVELERRRPGQSQLTTARQECDEPIILSGLFEGRTTGMPIAVIVNNRDARSRDYDHLRHQFRPGHADETYAKKFGYRDHRGGGRSSGRETLSRTIAGVVARKILPPHTRIVAATKSIGPHVSQSFDPEVIESNRVRCADSKAARRMERYVLQLKEQCDSTGGLIEVRVENPPPNIGEPIFGKLKARLADSMMSIGAVTGMSYGAGFDCSRLRGSEYLSNRDSFGGILGGISTGEPLLLEVSIKPTTSIGRTAESGRHDPCIAPRVIPVIEAMVAITLADGYLLHRAFSTTRPEEVGK